MHSSDHVILFGLGGIALGGLAVWWWSAQQPSPTQIAAPSAPAQAATLPTLTPPILATEPNFAPSSGPANFGLPPGASFGAANIGATTINIGGNTLAAPAIIPASNITFNIPAAQIPASGPAPAAGNISVGGVSVSSPQIAGNAITVGGTVGPGVSTPDGGTSGNCGCNTPAPYAGSAATQASTLVNQIGAASGAMVQNLSNPPLPPVAAPAAQASPVVQSYGIVAPGAFQAAYGTSNPNVIEAAMLIASRQGIPVSQLLH